MDFKKTALKCSSHLCLFFGSYSSFYILPFCASGVHKATSYMGKNAKYVKIHLCT